MTGEEGSAPLGPNASRAPRRRWKDVKKGEFAKHIFAFVFFTVILGLFNFLAFFLVFFGRWERIDKGKSMWAFFREAFLMDGGLFFFSLTLVGGATYVVVSCSNRQFRLLHAAKGPLYCILVFLAFVTGGVASMNDDDFLTQGKFDPSSFFTWIEIAVPIACVVIALIVTIIFELYSCCDIPTATHIKAGPAI